tara:strand:+ start:129 stop:392 length:264 start_codon:yes stop_codon:yes gene_type:complete
MIIVYLNKLIKTKIMKTKNDLKTGILIGIGMIVVPLLLMSTTNYSIEKTNKWEFHQEGQSSHNRGYLLNTENGEVYYLSASSKTLCK